MYWGKGIVSISNVFEFLSPKRIGMNNLKPIISHVHIDKVNEFYHEKEIEEIDFTLKYFNHLLPYFYDTGSFCAIYREENSCFISMPI